MFGDRSTSAKAELFDLLEHICQEFELTNTQYQIAQQRYEAVGEWLARSNNPFLFAVEIYAHGSIGLLTQNKPIKGQEHDVDLIVFAPAFPIQLVPSSLKHIVGARLREHAVYELLLKKSPGAGGSTTLASFISTSLRRSPIPTARTAGNLCPRSAPICGKRRTRRATARNSTSRRPYAALWCWKDDRRGPGRDGRGLSGYAQTQGRPPANGPDRKTAPRLFF